MQVHGLEISAARFPPDLDLPLHDHDRAIFAVILRGSMEVRFARQSLPCTPGKVQVHPPGEMHSQHYHRDGAEILVIEPNAKFASDCRPMRALLDRIGHFDHAGIETQAMRARNELLASDSLTPLALESLALDMFATAARRDAARRTVRHPPPWLERVTQRLRESFRERFTLSELAREAGVHPAHLARSFRRHHGLTIGDYLRRSRVEWSARQLAQTGELIADIASEAGFADQSHLTRVFRAHVGFTPAEFRRRSRAR